MPRFMTRLFLAAAVVCLAAMPATMFGQACAYTVTPLPPLLVTGMKTSAATITVTTGPTCSWTASSPSFVQVDDGSGNPIGTVTGSGSFRWFTQTNSGGGARTTTISVLPTGQSAIVIPVLQRATRSPSIYNVLETGFLSRDIGGGTLHVQNMKTDGGCAICRNAPQTPWGVNTGGTPGEGSDPHPTYSFGPVWPYDVSRAAAGVTRTSPGLYRRDPVTGTNLIDVPLMFFGTAIVRTIPLPPLPNPDYVMAGVGDFDGDRRPDIVWRNATTGAVALWILNSASNEEAQTLRTIVDLPGLPSNFVIGGAYDFNSDGIDDILWRNTTNGNNAVWLMNPTTPGFSSVVDLPGLPAPSFYVGALDDYDNDAQPDILWRNDTTDVLATWKMNGTTLVGVVNLAPLTGVSVIAPH